jgi:hypothetical protein
MKFKGKISYSVEKSYPDYSVKFFNNLAADEYMVQDGRKQNWKILSDKEKIGDLLRRKPSVILVAENGLPGLPQIFLFRMAPINSMDFPD